MSEDQIISYMIKGRECCRQLVLAYEKAREDTASSGERAPDLTALTTADRTVTRMLTHLQVLPSRLEQHMVQGEKKEYASRLMKEVSELLQKAMILEREVRESAGRKKNRSSRATSAPATMVRAYGAL